MKILRDIYLNSRTITSPSLAGIIYIKETYFLISAGVPYKFIPWR